jgi:hypothetical protein
MEAAGLFGYQLAFEGLPALEKEGYTAEQLKPLRAVLTKAFGNNAPTQANKQKFAELGAGNPLAWAYAKSGETNLAAFSESGRSKKGPKGGWGAHVTAFYDGVQRELESLQNQQPGQETKKTEPEKAAPATNENKKKGDIPLSEGEIAVRLSIAAKKVPHGQRQPNKALVYYTDDAGTQKRISADKALARADNRVKALKALRGCLTS